MFCALNSSSVTLKLHVLFFVHLQIIFYCACNGVDMAVSSLHNKFHVR